MMRLALLFLVLVLGTAACAPRDTGPAGIGADGKPLPKVYRIRQGDSAELQFRMLDSVNALRQASNLTPVAFDSKLNAAAATHAKDMSAQNRPWHFGSDGSSPIDRVQRVGYSGVMIGEVISETYETELETLAAWMEDSGSRSVIMDSRARDMGFAWHQEDNGKIWWTMIMGGGPASLVGF